MKIDPFKTSSSLPGARITMVSIGLVDNLFFIKLFWEENEQIYCLPTADSYFENDVLAEGFPDAYWMMTANTNVLGK